MFLEKTVERNAALIQFAIELHQSGSIMPDTYVIDLDAVSSNASVMLKEANQHQIKLFFMTKQIGRNPIVSKELVRLGFEGAVAVDFREAETLHDYGIPLAHVGHLVQTPSRMIERVVRMKPSWMTVYSVEKAREIDEACRRIGCTQNVLLRVIDRNDVLYPGQYGGIWLEDLPRSMEQLLELRNIRVSGLTSFPCFLFDAKAGDFMPTVNVQTMQAAKQLLLDRYGLKLEQMNMPSATCTHSIEKIGAHGGTHGEPGHGLLGTTPMHAVANLAEYPAIVYVSEISHQLDDKSYCYGGGYYQRTMIKEAIVADASGNLQRGAVHPPSLDSIDYHFELDGNYDIGQSVVMAFRTQIFVTRSVVAVVEGLSKNRPRLIGLYDSQGRPFKRLG
ncbi:YhfX family PLP-dependent enzyme [Paenibacillus sp. HWE-109]|uniref:YhfX family PLP-dependent enzyme n=1 Tax=Paenibacillus sp. HWE-109 TaxID=1306526 RepID=UPI001EDF42AE|nr:YhfX family PLP-dependent enzyme [Paenibacillus sp. HWE-109]UKS24818.1 YhfX family PLP-dependent enzyme [Paenibacillus sp. HWE-109]